VNATFRSYPEGRRWQKFYAVQTLGHPIRRATTSAEDVPRTLDFLFSRNRLNVAVSRAMCLACIVASLRLLESRARTIEQMRLINALYRFAEMAAEQSGVHDSAH
jgi:hypothetical protein